MIKKILAVKHIIIIIIGSLVVDTTSQLQDALYYHIIQNYTIYFLITAPKKKFKTQLGA